VIKVGKGIGVEYRKSKQKDQGPRGCWRFDQRCRDSFDA